MQIHSNGDKDIGNRIAKIERVVKQLQEEVVRIQGKNDYAFSNTTVNSAQASQAYQAFHLILINQLLWFLH